MSESVPASMVLVVVGAHPRAELFDREVATQLRSDLAAAMAEAWSQIGAQSTPAPEVIVLTDLWRLNDAALAHLPQIAVGHPSVNALTAFLAEKIPPAFVIDGELAVQFDAAQPEAVAACWGTTHTGTRRAVEEFRSRYLERFAVAAARELALS